MRDVTFSNLLLVIAWNNYKEQLKMKHAFHYEWSSYFCHRPFYILKAEC